MLYVDLVDGTIYKLLKLQISTTKKSYLSVSLSSKFVKATLQVKLLTTTFIELEKFA